ncbi:MAG TPA: GntR family transcriptional regulator [Hyphomicrobiales bacterium]|nr:GntR family transcriptional regulator [Hyphomicrobiales bacterium]
MDSIVEPLKSHRVYFVLKEQITSGALLPGGRLASEPELAERYGVSRVTVRKALDNLEHEGLIRRQPGAGTFVIDAGVPKVLHADLSDLLSHIVEMGRSTRVRLLSFGYAVPPPAVAEALGLGPGERVQRSVRVRLVDGQPFSYLTTSVPERIGISYSEADLASKPLLALIERSGIQVARATQSIRATLAGPEVAEALGVEIGASLLAVRRLVVDRDGRGVEHLDALYRPDRYEFTLELERKGVRTARRWRPAERPPSPRRHRPAKPAS